jgi:hypothetical protein
MTTGGAIFAAPRMPMRMAMCFPYANIVMARECRPPR